jgi:hypothetical protein
VHPACHCHLTLNPYSKWQVEWFAHDRTGEGVTDEEMAAYERLIRRLLASESRPAVLALRTDPPYSSPDGR